jgi:hypothetical protein
LGSADLLIAGQASIFPPIFNEVPRRPVLSSTPGIADAIFRTVSNVVLLAILIFLSQAHAVRSFSVLRAEIMTDVDRGRQGNTEGVGSDK